MIIRSLILAAAFCMTAGAASAQGIPGKVRSVALLQMIAERGASCDLLKDWEAAAIRAQTMEEIKNWSSEMRQQAIDEAQNLSGETECDAETLTVWIDAASKGFEQEFLPPYLVMYRTLASMEKRPRVFDASTLRFDYAPAIAAIDEKLAALEAAGAKPEGGQTWPEFSARVEGAADDLIEALNGENEGGRYNADEAGAFMAQSAIVAEMWLKDSAE